MDRIAIIAENGALVQYKGEVLFESKLEPKDYLEIRENMDYYLQNHLFSCIITLVQKNNTFISLRKESLMAWTFDEKSPIYLQIAYRVKLKIASKELSMGQQLLPVREFA